MKMITLQYGQEVLFITNEGKELDCHMFDNFDAVIRYHVKGTGHSSNEFMTVSGLQHGHMLSASGNNRPYADKQVIVHEGDTVIYREDRYVVEYMGDYSDALRFEPISPYTHCLEEDEEDESTNNDGGIPIPIYRNN
jgi:hypothetical protein